MRLLLAEDERSLSRALKEILERNHYTVDAVFNGEDALIYARSADYDGIILDLMMPKVDGLNVLSALRKGGDKTPIIILTARDNVDDKVRGLDLGANDYLTKPFDSKELLARIRAMTRKTAGEESSMLSIGNVTLDRATFRLSTPTGSLTLANKEFQMLELLMQNPRQLISTEKFLEKIWGFDSDADVGVVWVYLSYLRKKLKSLDADIRIKAMRNAGYSIEKK